MEEMLSSLAKRIEFSAIREIAEKIELARKDKEIISFGGGAPSYNPPKWLKEKLAKLAFKDLSYKYTATSGLTEVRESICSYLKGKRIYAEMDEVMVHSPGSTAAINVALTCLIDREDEVVMFKPSYLLYPRLTSQYLKGKIKWIDLLPELKLDEEKLKEAVSEKTKVLVVCSPNNPTGNVLKKKELKVIGEICEDKKVFIIHDEAYDEFVYKGKHHSFWELGFEEISMGIKTLSKFASMPGLRIAFSYSPKWLREKMTIISGDYYLCPPAISQLVLKEFLDRKKERERYVKKVRRVYQKRAEVLFREIKKRLPETKVNKPEGAFYLFPNFKFYTKETPDRKIADGLMEEKKVVVVWGSAFGTDKMEGYFRLTFVSEEEDRIREGVKRMGEFFENL